MGCGRVGARVAESLDRLGHSVSIIDQDADAWRRLSPDFSGTRITGIGFDRDRLLQAGIDRADAFVAVSSGDNSNIIAARVAREKFDVPAVVARIYDPRRAEVYERLGIATVGTVGWAADQVMRHLTPLSAHEDWRDPSGTVTLVQVMPGRQTLGRSVGELEPQVPGRIAFLVRYSEGVVPTPSTVIQEGDILHVACRTDDVVSVMTALSGERVRT